MWPFTKKCRHHWHYIRRYRVKQSVPLHACQKPSELDWYTYDYFGVKATDVKTVHECCKCTKRTVITTRINPHEAAPLADWKEYEETRSNSKT